MTLQAKRLQCAQLESELDKMRKALVSSSYQVDPTLHNDLSTIMSNNTGNITQFMNLFWQEQKKLSTVSGIYWSHISSNDNSILSFAGC